MGRCRTFESYESGFQDFMYFLVFYNIHLNYLSYNPKRFAIVMLVIQMRICTN